MAIWYLYMIRTRGGQLYTGIATDVERRFAEHCAGGAKAARYLRGRSPLTLVFSHEIGSRSAALRAERAVKKQSKTVKERIVAGGLPLEALFDS